MYWQKQFQQEDPDLALKAIIDAIREDHPNYGYRRILAVLRNRGIVVNKKNYNVLSRNLNSKSGRMPGKVENIVRTEELKDTSRKIVFTDGSPAPSLIKKSQPIRQNSSTTN